MGENKQCSFPGACACAEMSSLASVEGVGAYTNRNCVCVIGTGLQKVDCSAHFIYTKGHSLGMNLIFLLVSGPNSH